MDYDLTLPEEREKARQKALNRLARGREFFGVMFGLSLSFIWIIASQADWRDGINYAALSEMALPTVAAIACGFGWRFVVRRAAQYKEPVESSSVQDPAQAVASKEVSKLISSHVEATVPSSVRQGSRLEGDASSAKGSTVSAPAWLLIPLAIGTPLLVLSLVLISLLTLLYWAFAVGTFLPSRISEDIARISAVCVGIGCFLHAFARWAGWLVPAASLPNTKMTRVFEPLFITLLAPVLTYFSMINGAFPAWNTVVGAPQNIRMEVVRLSADQCVSIPRLADDHPVLCTGGKGFPVGQGVRVDVALKTSSFGVDIVGVEVDGVFVKNMHRVGSRSRQK